MLNATKQGYVTTAYGAKRPNRPGTALVLADGQHLTNLNMRLTRGSVISGVLVDQNGEPFSGATGQRDANRLSEPGNGRSSRRTARRPTIADNTASGACRRATTSISANAAFASQMRDNEIARLTDADIKRAMSEIAAGTARPGGPRAQPPIRVPERGRSVTHRSSIRGRLSPLRRSQSSSASQRNEPVSTFSSRSCRRPESRAASSCRRAVNPKTLTVQMVGSNPQGLMLDMFRRRRRPPMGRSRSRVWPPGPYAVIAQAQPSAVPAAGAPRLRQRRRPRHDRLIGREPTSSSTVRTSRACRSPFSRGWSSPAESSSRGPPPPPPDLSRVRVNLFPVQSAG